jgi:hypothetical protein
VNRLKDLSQRFGPEAIIIGIFGMSHIEVVERKLSQND